MFNQLYLLLIQKSAIINILVIIRHLAIKCRYIIVSNCYMLDVFNRKVMIFILYSHSALLYSKIQTLNNISRSNWAIIRLNVLLYPRVKQITLSICSLHIYNYPLFTQQLAYNRYHSITIVFVAHKLYYGIDNIINWSSKRILVNGCWLKVDDIIDFIIASSYLLMFFSCRRNLCHSYYGSCDYLLKSKYLVSTQVTYKIHFSPELVLSIDCAFAA